MSRVLKVQAKTDMSAVRSLRSAWSGKADDRDAPPLAVANPELVALREDRDRLLRLLEERTTDMSELRQQAKAAFREGEAQGREAGRREAEDQGAKSLAQLESGIERAVAVFTQAMSGLERLAPELARQGLAGILGVTDDRAEVVGAIVQRQVKTIEAHAIVHIAVSAADFGDEAARAHLESIAAAKIHVDSALRSGDCRIKLKLGTLEVGVDQQWGRLEALLKDMSEPAGGRHG